MRGPPHVGCYFLNRLLGIELGFVQAKCDGLQAIPFHRKKIRVATSHLSSMVWGHVLVAGGAAKPEAPNRAVYPQETITRTACADLPFPPFYGHKYLSLFHF